MKKILHKATLRILSLACVCLCVLSMLAFPASAADPVDALALQILEAVESGKSTVQLTVQTTDFKSFLGDVFAKYPTLYLYYDGYSSRIFSTYTEVDFKLRNHNVAYDSVYVAYSLEDVRNLVYYNLSCMKPDFRFIMVNGPEVSSQNIADLAHEMMQQHYFSYMGYHGNQISYQMSDTYPLASYAVEFHYWEGVSLNTLAQWRSAAEAKTMELAQSLFALDMPDYKKELLIHDWLVENNRYNTRDTSAPESHMAYSALVSGNPVCQGYAEAAMVLLQAAGIPTVCVSGDGTNSNGITESHAWNCVQIQGQWYNLDTTWDDPVTQDGSDVLQYDYFNVTDSQLGKDHTWDRSTAPRCTATEMNYDRVKSLVESDNARYTDYSDRNVTTRAMTQAQYGSQLLVCLRPGSNTGTAVPDVPVPTDPGYTLPGFVPQYTVPQYTVPGNVPGYTVPNDTPGYTQPWETEESDSSPVVILVIVGVGLVGVAVLIVFLVRKKKTNRRPPYQSSMFDPTDLGF